MIIGRLYIHGKMFTLADGNVNIALYMRWNVVGVGYGCLGARVGLGGCRFILEKTPEYLLDFQFPISGYL